MKSRLTHKGERKLYYLYKTKGTKSSIDKEGEKEREIEMEKEKKRVKG